jgi:multiple sugar transport system permease protein
MSTAAALTGKGRLSLQRPTSSPLVRQRRRLGWIMVTPAMLLVGALLWFPIGQAVYYGFTSWDGFSAQWIGLENYRSFASDPAFRDVVLHNALLLASLPFVVLLPLIVALLVNAIGRAAPVFRTLLFVPAVLSWVVTGTVGIQLFATNGPIDGALRAVGLSWAAVNWRNGDASAFVALSLLVIWALFGINFIIFLSGLSTFDESLYGAGRVDGANALQIVTRIVVPMLRPFVRFVTILSLTTMYTALFALIYVFTGGGPGYSTTTLEFYVYQLGFSSDEYGSAAAAGVLLLVLVFVVNLSQLRRFLGRSSEDAG